MVGEIEIEKDRIRNETINSVKDLKNQRMSRKKTLSALRMCIALKYEEMPLVLEELVYLRKQYAVKGHPSSLQELKTSKEAKSEALKQELRELEQKSSEVERLSEAGCRKLQKLVEEEEAALDHLAQNQAFNPRQLIILQGRLAQVEETIVQYILGKNEHPQVGV